MNISSANPAVQIPACIQERVMHREFSTTSISELVINVPHRMEHAETCRILDGHTGATPNSSDINISFFSQTSKDLANSGMYDVGDNPMDEVTLNEIQQECDGKLDGECPNGHPTELNHENMSFYNSIFENQSSQASVSSPSSRAHPSPGTASTSTVDTETVKRPQTGGTGARKTKVKGVSDEEAALLARDDTELSEKELQLKRKAQNRLAQRAFRERKETRMKELELKLTQSEDEKKRLLDQLDLVRKHQLTMQSENERLRSLASSSSAEAAPESRSPGSFSFAFPSTQEDFVQNLVGDAHEIDTSNINRVYEIPQEPGEKILAVGAVWDYLVRMAEESDKDIDVIEIMEKLKGHERCHGYGPAYPLKLVQEVAEKYSFS